MRARLHALLRWMADTAGPGLRGVFLRGQRSRCRSVCSPSRPASAGSARTRASSIRDSGRGCSSARFSSTSISSRTRRRRSVRHVHALPRGVPDRRDRRAVRGRCDALPVVPDDRDARRVASRVARTRSASTSTAATSARTSVRGIAAPPRATTRRGSRATDLRSPRLLDLCRLTDEAWRDADSRQRDAPRRPAAHSPYARVRRERRSARDERRERSTRSAVARPSTFPEVADAIAWASARSSVGLGSDAHRAVRPPARPLQQGDSRADAAARYTGFMSLAPALLLSMPQLLDPNFARTVILLCEHAAEGAFGWSSIGRRRFTPPRPSASSRRSKRPTICRC